MFQFLLAVAFFLANVEKVNDKPSSNIQVLAIPALCNLSS
jgi:hypothetical protein